MNAGSRAMRKLIASAALMAVVAVSACGARDQQPSDALAGQDGAASFLEDGGAQRSPAVRPAELSGDPDEWAPAVTPQR